MIWYISWEIISIWDKKLIVSCSGIWYRVSVPLSCLEGVSVWQNLALFVHTSVRENDISLFGFNSQEQLDVFELLISVNWIGPKTALEILSLPIEVIVSAISNEDHRALTQVKWIGQKASERIIIELKNKIKSVNIAPSASNDEYNIIQDAISWLEALWYKRSEIISRIRNAPEFKKTENLIRWFLAGE